MDFKIDWSPVTRLQNYVYEIANEIRNKCEDRILEAFALHGYSKDWVMSNPRLITTECMQDGDSYAYIYSVDGRKLFRVEYVCKFDFESCSYNCDVEILHY